jgi:precorrin-2 dehydrogenase/sirohydrochlorin ferrochelatase
MQMLRWLLRVLPELELLAAKHHSVSNVKKFNRWMLRKRHMVIACTDDLKVNKRIYDLCRKRYLICIIADTPPLCDYYLGGIVTKGNVKLRFRQTENHQQQPRCEF